MRHTTRLLLVPEELFLTISASSGATAADGTPLGLVRGRLKKIEQAKGLSAESRAAHYHQEFKRMNKLVRDAEERPLDVRVQGQSPIARSPIWQSPPPPPPTIGGPPTGGPVIGEPAIGEQAKAGKKVSHQQRRRPKYVKAARAPGRKRPPAAAKAVGVEEEEEEEWQDATMSPPPPEKQGDEMSAEAASKPSTSTAAATTAVDEPRSPMSGDDAKREVLAYIRANRSALGVNEEGKILKAFDGQPYRTSKIDEIIAYLLSRDKRRQFRQIPVGTKDFTERASQDKYLAEKLFSGQQTGSGMLHFQKHKKSAALKRAPFIFKPSLWF